MKPYFVFSLAAHGAFLALCIVMGTLLSKPRMSYYAVDLLSSLPSGSPVSGGAVVTPNPEAKPNVPAPAVEEEKPAPKEAIRVPNKAQKKPPAQPKAQKAKPHSAAFEAAMRAAQGEAPTLGSSTAGNSGGGGGAGGPGGGRITGTAGPGFPYQWYLNAMSNKLDKQWHLPTDLQSDTACVIAFTVHRDGRVSDESVEKRSGDATFDQFAMRAVEYSNPLPPLPAGYPDETLLVHFTFDGKHL